MRELKVYGWQSFRRDAPGWHGQTREIVAARSMAEVGRIVGCPPRQLFNLGDTGNPDEISVAMANPGVVHWRGSATYAAPWMCEDGTPAGPKDTEVGQE